MPTQDARKLDHATLEAIRIRAVQQVQAGESPEVVIRALGFSTRCIYNWLAMVAKLIRERTGVRLSLVSVGRLLAQLGLSCQKPLWRAYQQDGSRVEQWMKKEFPRIRALAKKEKALIFFEDESGVRSDLHAGSTWAVRGKTPVVRVTGQRFSLNMISAISPRGELRFMVVKGGVGAKVFITFLKRLVHGQRRALFLIVAGRPAHRAKAVRTYVDSLRGQLRPFFLPPYSPELNPDELVWNDVKNNAVGRMRVESPADLHQAIVSRLRFLQKRLDRVRSFFQAPETRYAA